MWIRLLEWRSSWFYSMLEYVPLWSRLCISKCNLNDRLTETALMRHVSNRWGCFSFLTVLIHTSSRVEASWILSSNLLSEVALTSGTKRTSANPTHVIDCLDCSQISYQWIIETLWHLWEMLLHLQLLSPCRIGFGWLTFFANTVTRSLSWKPFSSLSRLL